MKRSLMVALLLAFAGAARAGGQVAGSKHDFSASGPGPYRAVSERSPCVFCHASHDTGEKLSARPDPRSSYQPYASSTSRERSGGPTGASRICLSCHDGTIAVGQTRSRRIEMSGGAGPLPPGHRANVGTDLRSSHPVSIRPSSTAGVHPPAADDQVRLDHGGAVQCTSCHDPHTERGDPVVGKFLVKPSGRSAICLSCHDSLAVAGAGAESSHAVSSYQTKANLMGGRAASLAEAGCSLCHPSHGADARGQLRRRATGDDDDCLECHGEAGATKLLGSDMKKPWSHAASGRTAHDPSEAARALASGSLKTGGQPARHATCVDCHNPHAANATAARVSAPHAPGALAGVWGVNLDGAVVPRVRFEYEVCLKCHGDTAAPAGSVSARAGAVSVQRARSDTNLRLVFGPSAASSHPVAAPGRSADVPSLLAPYTAGSMIYCGDCHASDQAPSTGGQAARGPHGSNFPDLLERAYVTTDPGVESPAAYALCYKCHDREVLLSDRSAFPLHRRHVVERGAACATCHDAHGVSVAAGNARENAHLISFNVAVVGAAPDGRLGYTAQGSRHGSCALTCHGVPHDDIRSRY